MSKKHLSPAEIVINAFRGVNATARALGRKPSAISKWKKSRDDRGCGGDVPARTHRLILERARADGLDVTAEDLIYGRDVELVEA